MRSQTFAAKKSSSKEVPSTSRTTFLKAVPLLACSGIAQR